MYALTLGLLHLCLLTLPSLPPSPPYRPFVDFLCRFTGIWGCAYCIATYCVKDKESLMPANLFLNVMCLLCGPGLAELKPSAVGIDGVTTLHHIGLAGCTGSVIAHALAMAMPVKAKKAKK
jgi:hypothetical protein